MSTEREVLRDVRTAAQTLADFSGIAQYVPNVGTNIAATLPQPTSEMNVAAIPGRLHAMPNQIIVPSESEFGASKHVARALLVATQLDASIGGAVNLATSPALLAAARDLGLDLVEFDAAYENRMGELRDQFGQSVPVVAYHDGAYGIEPICYVFGESAIGAVQRVDRLLQSADVVDDVA